MRDQGYAAGWLRMFLLVDPWTPSAGKLSAVGSPASESATTSAGCRRPAECFSTCGRRGATDLDFPLLRPPAVGRRLGSLSLTPQARHRGRRLRGAVPGGGRRRTCSSEAYGDYPVPGPGRASALLLRLVAARDLVGHAARARFGTLPAMLVGAMGTFYLIAFVGRGLADASSGVHEAHSSPFGEYPIKRPSNFDAERLALWLKNNSGLNDRYAAGQKDMFDVISERRGYDLLPARTSPPGRSSPGSSSGGCVT